MKDGALQLTSAETLQERSLVVRAPRMSGQQYFAAEFDLFVGNGLGGEGVSACLGDLPDAPFGEEGAGEGLRVRLLTYADRLEILYDGELVLSREVVHETWRAGHFVPVRIAYDHSGLSVTVDGAVLARHVLLSTWSPQPTWRFGLGARTGEARTDDHHVDNLRLVVGAEVEPTSALLEVSSNGQQFTSSGVPFVFNAPHTVSSFYPERGPVSGSTEVVIRGKGFTAGADYNWRVGGSTVNESLSRSVRRLLCVSSTIEPNAALEVSLNAQQYTNSGVGFTYYGAPTVSFISPDSGPTAGDTLVRVFGNGLDAGAEYRCKFDEVVVTATLDTSGSSATVLCSHPPVSAAQLLPDGTGTCRLSGSQLSRLHVERDELHPV